MLTDRLSIWKPDVSPLFLRRLMLSICLVFSLTSALSVASNPSNKTLLILSGDSSVYQQAAAQTINFIRNKCTADNHSCQNMEFKKVVVTDLTNIQSDTKLIITFGTKAASQPQIYRGNHTVIRAMLPKQSTIVKKQGTSKYNNIDVYIDQPFSRYFELISTTLPRANRVGLLIHESNEALVKPLSDAAKSMGLTLNTRVVTNTSQTGKHLSRLIDDIDVFLAIPDSRIHNNKTISNILMTSYRNNIPVVGFSSAYVRAGAIAAVYTTLENIAEQVAETAYNALNGNLVALKNEQAMYFSVSINFDVARSLGIIIPSESEVVNFLNTAPIK
ncbi:MAG: hypothetical protein KZQ80_12410 [Candidatus Thiodiazotropha sp. (ex Monitilora ramsayi)]|nr:hypothetical protein [Candidatus Thiodiazotropha sp. (ex Monitilora ramsayi)]